LKPSSPNGTIARPDPELANSLQEVAKSLPKKFFVDERAIGRLVVDYKTARSEKRTGTQELNALFDKLYGVYVRLNACPKELDRFLYKCRARGITIVDLDTDLTQTLMEFYARGRSKKAIMYAAALCEAAMKRINVGFLGLRLGNLGPDGMNSIEGSTGTRIEGLMQPLNIRAMAQDFANRQKKPRKPRSSDK
jgi:hypothetical protein